MPVTVFFCYAREDEILLNQLKAHLRPLERQKLIDFWYDRNISAGTVWKQEINQHLNTAQIILLLISSDFMNSDYCYGIEMKRALEHHETGEARVIPIILRPVDWKGAPFGKLQMLPKNAKPVTKWPHREDAFVDIVRGIRIIIEELQSTDVTKLTSLQKQIHEPSNTLSTQGMPPSNPTLSQMQEKNVEIVPDPFPSAWNVPYRYNPFFQDSAGLLKRIRNGFRVTSEQKVLQPQALSGPGGIGKTCIATQYAFHYRREYEAIFWINTASPEVLRSQFLSLADELQLPAQSLQNQKLMQSIIRWLTEHTKWLLILDNVDDLSVVQEFIPTTSRGHILLTSRAHAIGPLAKRVEIEPMSPDEGALFLLRRANNLDDEFLLEHASDQNRRDAMALASEMGGLPLALDQAGAYIEETDCGMSGYLEVYQTHAKELLQDRGQSFSDHRDAVATTWILAFENIEKYKTASDLLRLCAYLYPDSIPDEIILQGVVGQSSIATDRFELNAATREFYKSSLIQRNHEANTFTIHRLVQAALRNWISKDAQCQWAERAVRAVHSVFPDVHSAVWHQCPRYLPHVFSCKELIDEWNFSFVEAAQLLYRAARYLHERDQLTEAEPLYHKAVALYETYQEGTRTDASIVLKQYADLLRKMQREDEALHWEQRAAFMRI